MTSNSWDTLQNHAKIQNFSIVKITEALQISLLAQIIGLFEPSLPPLSSVDSGTHWPDSLLP